MSFIQTQAQRHLLYWSRCFVQIFVTNSETDSKEETAVWLPQNMTDSLTVTKLIINNLLTIRAVKLTHECINNLTRVKKINTR